MNFPPAFSLFVALITALIGALAALARPWGLPQIAAVCLAALILVLVARGSVTTARRGSLLTLACLTLQFGLFLFTLAGSERLTRFRLLQVAAVAGYLGVTLAILLRELRLLPSRPALLVSIAVASGVLGIETFLSLAIDADELTPRPEWATLLEPFSSGDPDSLPDPGWSAATSDSPRGTTFFTEETPDQLLARAEAGAPQGPVWSGRADPHPRLGMVYRPHSTLKAYYRGNPRGYFEEEDFRERMWRLQLAAGNSAQLVFPPDAPEIVRIAISKANPDTAWQIHLDQPHLAVEARAPYALEFRARAERPRSMIVGMAQAHSPWAGLGLYERIELTPEWRGFRQTFIAARTDSNARIHFDVAGNDAPVELASVVLRGPHQGEPIEPELPAARHFVRYEYNAQGCRDWDYATPRPAGRLRILALGDAFTMGMGVREQDTFAKRLEESGVPDRPASAPERGSHLEVINCGVSGYGTREERLFYELFGASYRPDIVLLMMGLDDDRTYWEEARRRSLTRQDGKLAKVFSGWTALSRQRDRRRRFDYSRCLEDIRELDREVRQHGGRLIVGVLPTDSDPRWSQLSNTMTQGLEGTGIPILAPGKALAEGLGDEERRVDSSDAHPNASVHKAAAEQILRFLETHELGPRVRDSRGAQ